MKDRLKWVDTFGLCKNINFLELNIQKRPFEIFKGLHANYDHAFILESLTGPKEMAEFSVIGFDPLFIVRSSADRVEVKSRDGHTESYKVQDPLNSIRDLMPRVEDHRFRYIGGAVGYVSYDAIRYWERLPSKRLEEYPYMEFGIYTDGILFDHKNDEAYYFYLEKPRINDIKLEYDEEEFSFTEPIRNIGMDKFTQMVERAKQYIYDGDIYQVVLSKRFNFEARGEIMKVYANLREINPSPYMYMMKMNDREIIGSSPEMLVRVSDNTVETFPIAGTRPIGSDEKENMLLKEELFNDEKELAEHTMLVDLARNDIGRVCEWGSVRVDELMKIKEFSHVQHIVSHVKGRLRRDRDVYDAFRAVFPAGTVSGAPKVRAMEIIDELEPDLRGPYAGALGYFSFNGSCDFAITIRSIFMNGRKAYVQSGAGIVADSDPEREWMETEHKAGAMLEALRRSL